MAESRIELEIVSPEKLILSRKVDMVVVPGAEGDIGVLPRHSPMITAVRPGSIVIFEKGEVSDRFFIAGGFSEISENRCTVLAEEAMPIAELDKTSAMQALNAAREGLAAADSIAEQRSVELAATIAEAKIRALESPDYS